MKDRTMTNRNFGRILASSLVVTTVVACSGNPQMQQRLALASTPDSGTAVAVERALGAHNFARALVDAERLVEAKPREASYRTLLGRAYLASGRYQSAQAAFEDAITLGANDTRTIVSLALIQTALGNARDARDLLADHISDLPAADYGLGMAVAGDANEGVRALLEAVRQPDADAKTRQNLAYALALSGNWGQARLVGGQDLDGSELQQRLTVWAATAQSTALPQRVAALVGVAPRSDDSGLPQRLALSQSAGTALAAATPQPATDLVASAVADAPVQQIAAASPVIAPAASTMAQPQMVAAAAPTKPVQTGLMIQRIPMVAQPAPAPIRQPVAKRVANTAPAAPVAMQTRSDWVVQIGAYDNAAVAEAGWQRANSRLSMLRSYRKVSGTISLNGQTWHRLAVSGFGDRSAARQLCATLQRNGQTCFVRRDETVAPATRMAQGAKPAKLASR